MENIIKIVTELGSFGLLICLAGWIIYTYLTDKQKGEGKNDIKKLIEAGMSDIKTSIANIGARVTNLEGVVNDLKTKRPCIEDPARPSHPKQFLDRIKLGPQLHKTLNMFRARINADHIFIGSFHNGNESLTGIPYYKFDIIAEKFRPDKVERDIEFAFMYKDADLLRHDLLPTEVVQSGLVHYIIDKDGHSPLEDIDDIIYRRMCGRDIKQLAISLLRDPSNGMPSGFVGCVRYDYDKIDLQELNECGRELENVYAVNEKMIAVNNNKQQ
jgi:predicted DNA-binding transcriptional regulator